MKKTGRDRSTPSTAVPLQDGRTAPFRTLAAAVAVAPVGAAAARLTGGSASASLAAPSRLPPCSQEH